MHISSEHVGAGTKVLETEVSPRLAMNYAAAVGDNNPLYFDDTREDGVYAPPMAALAVTWPFSGNFMSTWDPDSFPHRFPYELMKQQVHFSETLVFHRPLRPGMKLRMRGEMVAILPHRVGTLLIVRYDAETASGEPVFAEYIGALLRRVHCEDGGRGEENLPKVPPCPETAGPLWEATLDIDPLAAHIYDGCTNMHFPIHTSRRFARSVKLKGIILQGAATLSYAVRELTDHEAGRDPSGIELVDCQFTGMVVPGGAITNRLLAREERDGRAHLHFETLNSQGRRAISNGYMRVRLADT